METQAREFSRLEVMRAREEMVSLRKAGGVNAQDVALALEMDPQKLNRLEKFQEFDQAFFARYKTTVRRIARERAEAVGWKVLDAERP